MGDINSIPKSVEYLLESFQKKGFSEETIDFFKRLYSNASNIFLEKDDINSEKPNSTKWKETFSKLNSEEWEKLLPKFERSLYTTSGKKLKNFATDLHCILSVWADVGLNDNKATRQAQKYKKDIDKSGRREIHEFLRVINLSLASLIRFNIEIDLEEISKNNELTLNKKKAEALKYFLNQAINKFNESKSQDKQLNSKNELKISDFSVRMANSYCLNNTIGSQEDGKKLQKELKAKQNAAQEALSSYKTQTGKWLSYLSKFTAFVGGIACGINTSISLALFFLLLFPHASLLIICTFSAFSVLVGLSGYLSNFRLFNNSLITFFLKLIKKSGITEFINEKGERQQLSNSTKWLVGLIGGVSALTAAATSAFFTYGLFIKVLTAGIIGLGPIAPVIIAGLFAGILFGVMGIVMFKSFVDIAPKISIEKLKEGLKSFKSFFVFSNILPTLLKGVAIVGLAVLCFSSLTLLTSTFGYIPAVIICIFSLAGQIPFTWITISAFCKKISNFFSNIGSFCSDITWGDIWATGLSCLNAIGNAALTLSHTILSFFASIGNFLCSFAGTMQYKNPEETKHRTQADKATSNRIMAPFEICFKEKSNLVSNGINSTQFFDVPSSAIKFSINEESHSINPELLNRLTLR